MATKRFAVLGSPIEHSKSPLIHNTAYGVLGLDWSYDKIEVPRAGLRKFISELDAEWAGFSVTMPLKEEAFRFVDSKNEAAELTGAVNTLARTETGWAGYNTDVFGIVQAVRTAAIGRLNAVLIIGSGATATSAVVAVRELAPDAKVLVFARNSQARAALVSFAGSIGLQARSVSSLKSPAQRADLVISTLPGGALDEISAKLNRWFGFNPRGAVLDVAYSPWPSAFAAHWSKAGRPTISGLDMLMWQAIAQLRIFTQGDAETPLPNEVAVVEAVRHALDN
jgi:shikimate dehydrogenase